MKSVQTYLTRLLLVASLMLPWATTEATEIFREVGIIANVKIGKIYLQGKELLVTPSTKLENRYSGPKKPSDLKKGDFIAVKGRIIAGDYFVDFIQYRENDPS